MFPLLECWNGPLFQRLNDNTGNPGLHFQHEVSGKREWAASVGTRRLNALVITNTKTHGQPRQEPRLKQLEQ